MWSAATKRPCHDDITHVLPLRLRDLSGRTPSRSHHHSIRSGMTFPCVQITGCAVGGGDLQNPTAGRLSVICVGFLGQQRLVVNSHAEFFGQRFDGLVAARAVRGGQRVGAECEQLADK